MFFKKQLPNILSLARMFVISPLLLFTLLEKQLSLVVIILVFGFLSDLLDGLIARKWGVVSNFGKWIDPLADKIFLFCFFYGVIAVNDVIWRLPIYTTIIIDAFLILISGTIILSPWRKYYYGAHWTGKTKFVIYVIAVSILSAGVFSKKVEIINISYPLFFIGNIFGIMSLGVYVRKAIKGYLIDKKQLSKAAGKVLRK